MTVGIMTMHRIVNYGSFMQALALKRIVEGMGHKVVFVDYHVGPCIDTDKSIKNKIIYRCKALKSNIGNLAIVRKLKFHHKYYDEVFMKYCYCYNLLDIDFKNRFNAKVDLLIIGSDEVFNCLQKNPRVGFSRELFGEKNNAKKMISYAASFGSTTYDMIYENKIDAVIGQLLNNFDCLSVRDDNSVDIIKRICSKVPQKHLDPVIVGDLENLDWIDVSVPEKYVLVYGYKNRFSHKEGKAIYDFATEKDCEVISVGEAQEICNKNIVCRPDEVLSYFQKASYIVTDTFHGTIFSVLFQKPFAVFLRAGTMYSSTNSEKLSSLLRDLGVEDQAVNSLEDLKQVLSRNIDYSNINNIRRNERHRTEEYLNQFLN